ncbi:hypothetical protein PBRA_008537 [Plasmodiophora brassicae]|uniref:CDC20/Fizzy WD40 domain-containing protein n=1 Tax=Plasmodiophora brassicae TaxID=37360 RepID=A0A0G4J242_PLABS|nr:hypothetical protein PBRA_008537 [Plasmodiophora brassicae]
MSTSSTPAPTTTPGRRRLPFAAVRVTPSASTPGDRFIPPVSALQELHTNTPQPDQAGGSGRFKQQLADELDSKAGRVLSFRQKAPAPPVDYQNSLRVLYTQNRYASTNGGPSSGNAQPVARRHRFVSSSAERVLDAPDLLDDYYVNLLDWSGKDALAVGLGSSLYLWDAATGGIDLLMETTATDHITAVAWMQGGTHIAVGTDSKEVQLWDVQARKKVRAMRGHAGRVSALAWNRHILSSGSRDSLIHNHDVRVSAHLQSQFRGHQLEVCGLRWSPDGGQLASGGNDNLLHVWELAAGEQPRLALTDHTAAVKALAWSPHTRHLLASGGGTNDRRIRFWNTKTGACLNSVDTNSQVCGLVWNPHESEILSAHGFSKNQLTLWKYPSLGRVTDLIGHSSRVLHMTLSPDGTTVCSAAADETLRFWKVFEPVPKPATASGKGRPGANQLARKLTGLSIR